MLELSQPIKVIATASSPFNASRPVGLPAIVDERWSIALFAAAITGFALCAHRESLEVCRWLCLFTAGAVLCSSWIGLEQPLRVIWGTPRLRHMGVRVAVVGILGVLAGTGYRLLQERMAFPLTVHSFAVIAMCVGACEEVVWRGWMQGWLMRRTGTAWAITLASLSHTCYKSALFLIPPAGVAESGPASVALMCACTFGFGLLLGVFRARQGTILGPIAFHAAFDLMVYGDYVVMPWWVF